MTKLSEIYQNLINEKKDRPFKKGCLMANFEISDKSWGKFLKRIKKEDLYIKEDDNSYGLEDEPHVTILYGLDPKYSGDDVFKLIKEINLKQFDITITDVDYFNNDEYNVLKFSVSSDKLKELNGFMKNKFEYENDYPDYKAHITIGYLNKEADIDSYIEDIARASGLYGGKTPKLTINELTYSGKNGKSKLKLKK